MILSWARIRVVTQKQKLTRDRLNHFGGSFSIALSDDVFPNILQSSCAGSVTFNSRILAFSVVSSFFGLANDFVCESFYVSIRSQCHKSRLLHRLHTHLNLAPQLNNFFAVRFEQAQAF